MLKRFLREENELVLESHSVKGLFHGIRCSRVLQYFCFRTTVRGAVHLTTMQVRSGSSRNEIHVSVNLKKIQTLTRLMYSLCR